MTESIEVPQIGGTWRSRYEYSSAQYGENLASEHMVTVDQHGKSIIVKNKPDPSGSFLNLDLAIDGRILTGTWHERTSPQGDYHGKTFRGAVQFILDESGVSMHGMWVGHNSELTEVKSGPWTLEKLPLEIEL